MHGNTPKKESRLQVPSSSPINIKSSPVKQPTMQQPSLSAEKEKQLEATRQRIRQHSDFPIIRKQFWYLSESDILKGFVKGKGNAREVTKYLEDTFDRSEFERKKEEESKRKIREQEELRKKNQELRFQEKLQQSEKANAVKTESGLIRDTSYDEEDESPVKIKGRAKPKIADDAQVSPTKKESTKVNVTTKRSIVEKFNRPKQATLDNLRFGRLESLPKKRKLTRFSSPEPTTPTPTSKSSSISPVPVPDLSRFRYNGDDANKERSPEVVTLTDPEEEKDEIEILEERIAENKKRNRKPKNIQNVIEISDEDDLLEDEDDDSDSMEEEDDNVYGGYTSIDGKILEFINNASIQDLADICAIDPKVAEIVVSQRPFATIDLIAENDFALPGETVNKRRKKMGMRMIENTETNLKGYKAIDSLIKKCSSLGQKLTDRMDEWGVTITGDNGELNMVDLDPVEDTELAEKNEDGDDEIIIAKKKQSGLKYIKHKPSLLAEEITLNNYQQVGINWLNLLYHNKLSCILADEMGLGKTCQVIAFMAHLKEVGEDGPHLVIVPASTIENWLREFNKFCPSLRVRAYYGAMAEREQLRFDLEMDEFDVLVTTYNLACGGHADAKFLKNRRSNVIVYDEGHLLKNSTSDRYMKLMKLKGKFRLLLTGTPLQNNLKELVSLLSFMLPDLFNEKREELASIFNQKSGSITKKDGSSSSSSNYNPLLAQQAIKNARTMMTPFVLRRRKDQVLQHLPAKSHEIVHCELTPFQSQLYFDFLNKGRSLQLERERRRHLSAAESARLSQLDPIPTSSNVLMDLRKAALHPLLFRGHFSDSTLKEMSKAIMMEPQYVEANQTYIFEDMQVMSDFELDRLCAKFPKTLSRWKLEDEKYLDSGKILQLKKILDKIILRGEKILIFSLFTQVLDILEKVLSLFDLKFVRLDGSTKVDERQDTIDIFNDDPSIPIFLLSTKAGGFGINLVAANNVIIFDQSFNPHDDKQAEDRAHRVGQKKEVTVYKMITDKTIEKNMLLLAENKLALDKKISVDESSEASKLDEQDATLFEKILYEQNQ
ncbi:ATP-dependent helicase FUN30 [Candida viswanathii]|uniref:DNA helicase n=1 Tax=Candida viswanathii TaxID=5486 RepID=A0A367YLH9_9ASCO|nr:ATP-dependent helicase FUN30 [Candida viswanathii]